MEDIRNLVRELGLGSKVWLPGKLPPKEAASFLRHAWAGINLLRDEGLSYRYSLANKFFDYVHAGIPQICIRFPEYEARFSEFQPGVLCDLQPDSIQDAMDTISIPENQAFFRNQAQLASGVWNWETEETKLIQLYDALLRPEAKALGQ
jgi:glycosyltransferase involved in cell wall biosynthesis